MDALVDVTDSQIAVLGELVESLRVAESTLASMMAARDGLLALASQWALAVAQQGDHPDHGDLAVRTVAAEIGAALHVSDRSVERRMDAASWLVEGFPAVWAAQSAGRIGVAHARVIVDAAGHLTDPGARDAYAREVLPLAETLSPNRLRGRARRIADRYQVRTVTERHRDAHETRRVWVRDGIDGMAQLGMTGPAVLVHGIYDRLTQMATMVQDAERAADAGTQAEAGGQADAGTGTGRCVRTRDQLRADLLAELLLTGTPHGHDTPDGLLGQIRGQVEISVPALTLIAEESIAPASADGMFSPPAELNGTIPIDTPTARLLAGGATGWDRVLTHPITGSVLAVDRYRPTAHLTRHLRARDHHCRFPGCRNSPRGCDIDHTHAAATGGPTTADNLAHLCRRHHTLKHHSPWHVTLQPDGTMRWQSPTGQIYPDRPPPHNSTLIDRAIAPPF